MVESIPDLIMHIVNDPSEQPQIQQTTKLLLAPGCGEMFGNFLPPATFCHGKHCIGKISLNIFHKLQMSAPSNTAPENQNFALANTAQQFFSGKIFFWKSLKLNELRKCFSPYIVVTEEMHIIAYAKTVAE